MSKKDSKNKSRRPWIRHTLTLVSLLLLSFFVYTYGFKKPSSDRLWHEDFRTQAEVVVDGDRVSIGKVRDWRYQGDQIVSKGYVDREYDANNLETVWFILEPFGAWDGVAHTYLTFDFTDQPPVSFSIEALREENEPYSALSGLFNNYELTYTWGTEEDFLLRRVVYLDHDVYMVPLKLTPAFAKRLFLSLARSTQALEQQPRFYNTIDTNCTNVLADEVNRSAPGSLGWDWARVFTGYSGRYLTKNGFLVGVTNWEKDKQIFNVSKIVKDYTGENVSGHLREKVKLSVEI